jgi:hypothetical protein
LPFCIRMGGCQSLHVLMKKCWIIFKCMDRCCCNFQDLSKFLQVIFVQATEIIRSPLYFLSQKTACFFKIYLLLEFLSYGDMTYLFRNRQERTKWFFALLTNLTRVFLLKGTLNAWHTHSQFQSWKLDQKVCQFVEKKISIETV